jgi:membrane-bound acyltransferase YfiQ involved in biofilm formation
MMTALKEVFINYEEGKLAVFSPDLVNITIFFVFFVFVLLSAKKDKSLASEYLGHTQTDQLKGLAIFLVIVGHLWVHVADRMAHIVLSGDGVAVFLMLSGYGLTISWSQDVTFRGFFTKRLKRVMIPYWIATVVILMTDWVLLDRRLDIVQIMMTALGINVTRTLTHLDYVRWFVTFILLWYGLFYFARRCLRPDRAVLALLIAGVPLLPLNYYLLHFGWYQFLAFPIGCAVAVYRTKIIEMYKSKNRLLVTLSVTAAGVILAYKATLQEEHIRVAIVTCVPNIVLAYFNDAVSTILCVAALLLSMRLGEGGYYSRLLVVMGRYSYELFLLHGVFLIKYNPIVRSTGAPALVGEFAFYMLFISLLAYLLAKATGLFHAPKRA